MGIGWIPRTGIEEREQALTEDMQHRASWELSRMVYALSRLSFLNTEEDNMRLQAAVAELQRRNNVAMSAKRNRKGNKH